MTYIISQTTSGTSANRRVILDEDGEIVIAKAGQYTGNQYSQRYVPEDDEKRVLLELKRYFVGRQIISVPNGPDWQHCRFEILPCNTSQ